MFWDTYIEQDCDGHWVAVNLHDNNHPAHRYGPYPSDDEAKAAELQVRIEMHRRHGSPDTP